MANEGQRRVKRNNGQAGREITMYPDGKAGRQKKGSQVNERTGGRRIEENSAERKVR